MNDPPSRDGPDDPPAAPDATSPRSFLADEGDTRVDATARSFDVVETTEVSERTTESELTDEDALGHDESTLISLGEPSHAAEETGPVTRRIHVDDLAPNTVPIITHEVTRVAHLPTPARVTTPEPTSPVTLPIDTTRPPLPPADVGPGTLPVPATDLNADLFAPAPVTHERTASSWMAVEATAPVQLPVRLPTMPPFGPLSLQPLPFAARPAPEQPLPPQDPDPTEVLPRRPPDPLRRYTLVMYALLLIVAGLSAALIAYFVAR